MDTPGFRLFGFPVHVRPGFVVFLLLVVVLYQGSLGLWAAGAIAVFTLVHELGHAFAARATGARAEIALDFLAGYASYAPSRELQRWERAGIAFAGPATQLAAGVGVLVALGANPLSYDSVVASEATIMIWWAGVALAFVNLLPVLPLDGGNIVATGLDAAFPGRGRSIMTWVSLVVTGVLVLAVVTNDDLRPFTFLVALLGVLQLQQLSAGRRQGRAQPQSAQAELAKRIAYAEEQAWTTGRPGPFPAGSGPSPWFLAHRAFQRGDPDAARRLLVDDLADPRPGLSWWPPDAADDATLATLAALVPDDAIVADRWSAQVLIGVLVRVGHHERAARLGAEEFTRSPSSAMAVLVARSVARLGDSDLAVRWLQAAADAGDTRMVAHALDRAPELAMLTHRPDVRALRQSLAEA